MDRVDYAAGAAANGEGAAAPLAGHVGGGCRGCNRGWLDRCRGRRREAQSLPRKTVGRGRFLLSQFLVDPGCDDRNADHAVERWVNRRAGDDVALRHDFAGDALGGFVDLVHGQIGAAGNVQQNALGRLQVNVVEQRVLDGALGRVQRPVFAIGLARAHHRFAHNGHQRAHVGKIEVDVARVDDQVGNCPNAVVQHFVGHLQRVGVGGVFVGNPEQVLVRDHDQGVDGRGEEVDAFLGLTHAHHAFECEGLSRDADSQDTALLEGFGDQRGCTGAGAAAHASGDEHHVDVTDLVEHVLQRFFRCRVAHHGVRACAQALRGHGSQSHATVAERHLERLCIGVGYGKLHALEVCLNHIVNSVSTGAADAEDEDPGLEDRLLIRDAQIKSTHKILHQYLVRLSRLYFL